jgi:tetratricopeptide (TPR) repeat protein
MKHTSISILTVLVLVCGVAISTSYLHRSMNWAELDPYYLQLAEQRQRVPVLLATILNQRKLAADAYWSEFLVYSGSSEWSESRWPEVLPMTLAGTLLNPRFVPFYEYGSAILAWQLGRRSEALELLAVGIRHNPSSKRLMLYAAAIEYQNRGSQQEGMVQHLRRIIFTGEYSPLLPPMLANIYKVRGEYESALEIWHFLMRQGLSGKDLERAKQQVAEIQALQNSSEPLAR